jgi:6-pyruvoyltetrahydropterin/6-carboxytetrahydropterin synthase
MNLKTTFTVTEPFEAARHVGVLPEGHRSRRLHGHSFLASVHCAMPKGFAIYPGGEIDTIRARLQPQIKKLDYTLLNDQIEVPTDENIARWINAHCYVPGTQGISVQSTVDEGLEIDKHGMARVWRRYYFHAAHQLPNVQIGHKCGNMHGHSFAVVLHAVHHIDEGHLSIDYDVLDEIWAPVFNQLDHECLNEIVGLSNPTSETISKWIWEKIKPTFGHLSCVTVYETASCGANYDGNQFEIWKDFSFDSSAKFARAPLGSKRTKLHGYTYLLRLRIQGQFDEKMGWVIDFGDVKEAFNPIFKTIDHQPLWKLEGLLDSDVQSVANYVFKKAKDTLPYVTAMELYESTGNGVAISEKKVFALPI